MPEMLAAKRASGSWVADGSLAPATPLQQPAKPCGYWEGGDHCGALTERRYPIGPRCPRHTPAAVAGRPEPSPDLELGAQALGSRRLPVPDQCRYGRATTDPLGREGPGWHKGKQTGLPTRDKRTKGD